MNLAALFDGLLALACLALVLQSTSSRPAMRLGATVLGIASLLGTLRFSGLMPLPQWHQFFSMLGAAVALPLLAIASVAPVSGVASRTRYAWIFAVIASVFAVLLVVMASLKLWASVCALAAAIGLLGMSLKAKNKHGIAAGATMLFALLAFALKAEWLGLRPGDWLHIGLAASMVCLWLQGRAAARS